MSLPSCDRFVGCLLGGALGDALGAPVEFMRLAEIRQQFGPAGLRDLVPAYGRAGAITDDTQMTLFTAEGLVRAVEHRRGPEGWDPVSHVHRAYLRWLKTQDEISEHSEYGGLTTHGLASLPELNAHRAPGNTCLSALRSSRPGTRQKPLNNSKGCGGVMRVAPAGLAVSNAFSLGCDIAALTHGAPTGFLAAGHFAQVIAEVSRGSELRPAITRANDLLTRHADHVETLGAVEQALRLAETGKPSAAKLETLGEGWVAEEALAIALYCALTAGNIEAGLVLAVNHSGDSDSTGSLTGNLLGALWGHRALPEHWLAHLELRVVIEELAHHLYDSYRSTPEYSRAVHH